MRSGYGNGHQAAGVRIRIFTDFQAFSEMYFLYAVPCAHVEDLSVVPTLNDTFDEGTLSVSIKADGDGIASVKLYELGDLSVEKI